MIAVYPVLRQYIKNTGVSWHELAIVAGIHPFIFHLKIWGIKRWTLTEAVRICGFFNTPNVELVFVRNYNKQQFLESQEKTGNV
jgi:hypothetical protein